MKNKEKHSYNHFTSPMPPHLTPEERAEWEKEMKWQEQEVERRKKEGMYPNDKKSKAKVRRKRKISKTKYQEPYHG